MKPIAIFTTAGSADEARRIARTIAERQLAACVQIVEIESFVDGRDAPYAEWIREGNSGAGVR